MRFYFHLLWRQLTALIVLALSTGCTADGDSNLIEFRDESSVVPLRFANNTPLIDVVVNGHGPYLFMLDTGSTNIMMADDLIEELKLPKLDRDHETALDARGMEISSRLYGLDSLSIGSLQLKNVTVRNLDMCGLRNTFDPKLKGIIGYWCFRQSCMRFDFPNSRLIVMKNPPPPGQTTSSLPLRTLEEYSCETMPKTKTPSPCIPIKLGQHQYTFMIDTGCAGSLLISETVATSLTLYRTRSVSRSVGAARHPFQVVKTRLNGNLALGSVNVQDPYIDWTEKVPGQNVIGMEILKQLTMDIDFINGIARFQYTDGSPVTIPDRKVFGVSIDVKNNKARVVSVDPRLTAQKIDIQPGDEVIKIDAKPANRVTDSRMRKLMMEKDSISLQLRRNHKEFSCVVPVLLENYSK